ncbi:MAG: class I tRNA ligase family protein, partial [Candidatus Roizmanbacteria bacterium]|nr:class I tRNA ligase family protein [Candidatus Roizmanbacteria bacterium]
MDDKTKYNPSEFESKMFELWKKEEVYSTNIQSSGSKREKAFCLSMFPYPSGAGLHVGHVRIYTGTDVLARYFKMIGRDVLHPMGWDAFGLPAENAAIKAKKNPIDMVPGNITNFKRQMNMLGLSYDWKREFSTTDPSYYKWTQWLFIQFFKMGLLYKRNTPIHWCPKCKTGLAEEEVLANGTHERCGSEITKKELPQWIFRITAYAEQLLDDLKLLDWPKGILEMQKNWIGKKEGVNVQFKAEGSNLNIECFTTRIDTLFGVVAVVVAPEHQIAVESAKKNTDVKKYIDEAQKKSAIDREDNTKKKTGVFTTQYVLHPLTDKKIPVWVGDYVLGSVGTGAVMVVPAHDQRDFDFAKVYGLEVIPVVAPQKGEKQVLNEAYENDGIAINSGKYSDLPSDEARKAIAADLEVENKGKKMISYHLR